MSVTSCSICGKPAMNDNGPVGDIVDCYKYEFDGSLDYIMLMHRKCALAKGYKIKGDRVVTEGIFDIFKQKPLPKGAVEYRCSNCSRTFIDTGKEIEPECPHCGDIDIEMWDIVRESQQVGEYPQVNEALPEPREQNPIKEGNWPPRYHVRRIPNTPNFVIVDTGHGKTYDTYLDKDYPREGPQAAAQRDADELNRLIGPVHRIGENSDAAPAIAKNECSTPKRFGAWQNTKK